MEDSITAMYGAVIREFSTTTENEKLKFLLKMSYRLTVVARDVFSSKDEQVQLRIVAGISEINHQIMGYVVKSMSESTKNSAAEKVFLTVLKIVSNCGLNP